ncbi:hypothetical protein LIER_38765 [Lithospermum erythrorhizon]|uniref:Uncharacterized protein n=1 Tax=Lithospermum erythrorhizon TaxID=34254 RepID=A0AAV3Q4G1_LITER
MEKYSIRRFRLDCSTSTGKDFLIIVGSSPCLSLPLELAGLSSGAASLGVGRFVPFTRVLLFFFSERPPWRRE